MIRNEKLDIRKPYVTRKVPISFKNKHMFESLVNRRPIKPSDEYRRISKSFTKNWHARDAYYNSNFEKTNGDSKCIWKTVTTMLNRN